MADTPEQDPDTPTAVVSDDAPSTAVSDDALSEETSWVNRVAQPEAERSASVQYTPPQGFSFTTFLGELAQKTLTILDILIEMLHRKLHSMVIESELTRAMQQSLTLPPDEPIQNPPAGVRPSNMRFLGGLSDEKIGSQYLTPEKVKERFGMSDAEYVRMIGSTVDHVGEDGRIRNAPNVWGPNGEAIEGFVFDRGFGFYEEPFDGSGERQYYLKEGPLGADQPLEITREQFEWIEAQQNRLIAEGNKYLRTDARLIETENGPRLGSVQLSGRETKTDTPAYYAASWLNWRDQIPEQQVSREQSDWLDQEVALLQQEGKLANFRYSEETAEVTIDREFGHYKRAANGGNAYYLNTKNGPRSIDEQSFEWVDTQIQDLMRQGKNLIDIIPHIETREDGVERVSRVVVTGHEMTARQQAAQDIGPNTNRWTNSVGSDAGRAGRTGFSYDGR